MFRALFFQLNHFFVQCPHFSAFSVCLFPFMKSCTRSVANPMAPIAESTQANCKMTDFKMMVQDNEALKGKESSRVVVVRDRGPD